jgi:hypothetical protein
MILTHLSRQSASDAREVYPSAPVNDLVCRLPRRHSRSTPGQPHASNHHDENDFNPLSISTVKAPKRQQSQGQ